MMKDLARDGLTQRRLIVEGKLIAPWAAELRSACENARADLGGPRPRRRDAARYAPTSARRART